MSAQAAGQLSAREEWRTGWYVVLAAFVGYSFVNIMTASLSMFIEPVSQEFNWSRTFVSSGFTIGAIVTALLSPFFGIVVDRYGSRKVALPGVIITAFGIGLIALANGSHMQWYVLWGFYAVISITVKATVWTQAVAGIFTAGQGLALGITLCGTAAAQIIVPPLTHWLIESYGWRMAYVSLGLGWGGVTLLICWLCLYSAHDRYPAISKTGEKPKGERPEFPGLTIAQAWRDGALWRIVISSFITMLLSVGLTIHQIPILNEAGVTRGEAALLASMAGVAAVVGKLVTGVLLDRYRPNWVGGLTLAASALAFGLLIDGILSTTLIIFAMLVNGYTQGTKFHIISFLTARYAGMRNFGTIYGFMNSVVAFASGFGPLAAGLIFDFSGNYTLFLVFGVAGSIVCGLLLLTLPNYPSFQRPDAATADRA